MHLFDRVTARRDQFRPFARRCRPVPTFDRFTGRAQDVITLAQDEARRLGHDFIGTEHVLLGILRRVDSVGGQLLNDRGVRLGTVRTAVAQRVGRGRATTAGERRVTPRLKRVFALVVEDATGLGHDFVGTEHLLLGILRDGDGVAAHILREAGVTVEAVRGDVLRIVGRGPIP